MYDFNKGIGSSNDKDPNNNRDWFRARIKYSIQDLSDGISTKKTALIITLVIGFVVSAVLLDVGGVILAVPIALAIRSSIKHDEYMINRKYRLEEKEKEKEKELQAREDKQTENRYLNRGERFNKYLANPKTDIKLPEVDPKNEDTYRYYIVRNGFLPYFDSDYSIDGIDKLSYLEHNVYLYYDGVSLKELVTGIPAKMWDGNINNQTLYFDSLTEIKDLSQIGSDIKSYGVENYKKYIFDTISYNTVLARYSAEASKDKNNAENFVKGLIDNHR